MSGLSFARSISGQTYDGYNVPYTFDNFSITRLDTIGRTPVAVCSGCHQDTLDMTEYKASSNLDAGVTFNGINILHNGVTWRPQSTAAISLHNQAIKVVNSGGSSEGVLALPALSLVEPNTTYIMECDIVEVSPGITELAFYAIDNTGAPYRVTSVEAGIGHRSIVFTTGATLGTYLTFRASARPATAGLYFVIDNFVFRKYKTVDQVQYYGTDFSAAVMNGTDVYDNGRLFRPWTSLLTSLSVVGTVDKKIEVSAGTVNESRLRTDMPAIGGVPYLVKFTLGQAEPDKRAFIELLYRTGGGTWTTFIQGLFYTGSGDYQLNFTLPAGADELRVGFLRNSTGSIYDGLGVPYTIDNFSVTRITPQEQMIVTVCDTPPGGDAEGLYRYGFNGKENDNEVKGEGNQQDYGMRIYDPRLGRFLSVDPLTQEYPWYTPYQYAGNKPIWCIDLDGLEEVLPKFDLKVTRLTNVSESTCIGCAERTTKIHVSQSAERLQKLKNEYEAWSRDFNNIGKPLPPQYAQFAPQSGSGKTFQQGGYLASKEYMLAKANYDTYGKFLPGLSDLEDGLNLSSELKKGNYRMAAMYGLFLLPGGDFAKPVKGFLTRLAADGAEYALKNVSRLQHAFKHAGDIKQFAGKNWNKEIKEAWKNFNSDILQTATKSFDNILGKDPVKGFYKNVDGQDIAVYIYKGGDKAGEIATTVVLTPNQMIKFGLQ